MSCRRFYFSGNQLTDKLATEYLDSIGDNSFYALKYTVAEVLCLVSSIVQIVFTNKVRSYLHGEMVSVSFLTVPEQ